MAADFSLLNPSPNFAAAALAGYQSGQKIQQQQRSDAALQGVDLERPETILPLLKVDPSTGAALLGASTTIANQKRDNATREHLGNFLKLQSAANASNATAAAANAQALGGGQSAPPSPAIGATPTAPADPNQITVTAPKQAPQPDPLEASRQQVMTDDPEGYLKYQKQIGEMNDQQIKHANDVTDTFASLGQQALQLPYPQRKMFIMAQSSLLAQHGVPLQMIQNFDPTDDNLHAQIGHALGIKGQLDQADKDRSAKLAADQFENTKRHQGIEESQGAAHVAIAGGELSLGQANLGMRKQEFGQLHSVASGSGVAAPKSSAEYAALPKGARYSAPDGSTRVKN